MRFLPTSVGALVTSMVRPFYLAANGIDAEGLVDGIIAFRVGPIRQEGCMR